MTALEPFTREQVQGKQPHLYKHLQDLFGSGSGSYKGSLNEHPEIFKKRTQHETPTEEEDDD